MKENNFLTLGEFYDVCDLIRVCAQKLVDESYKDIPKEKDYPHAYKDNETLDVFMECYKSSIYAHNVGDNYIKYVRVQAEKKLSKVLALKTNRHERIRILAPFVFYSLVVLNEADTVKAKRRRDRFQKATQENKEPVSWRQTNPYQKWETIYRPLDLDNNLEEQIVSISERAYKNKYYSNPFISDAAKSVSQEIHKLKGHLHYLRCISNMAGAGAFLHDVLQAKKDENNWLDTILQMSCIMHFQNVLPACRLIIDEEKTVYVSGKLQFKNYKSMDIVQAYAFEKLGDDIQDEDDFDAMYFFPICFKGSRINGLIAAFMKEINKKDFITIYKFLTDHFQFNFPGLIEMFVDKEKLEPLFMADSVFSEYIEVQNKFIAFASENNEFSHNLHNLLKSVEKVRSCRDILSTQPYVSKFKSKEEEESVILQEKMAQELNEIAIDPSICDTDDFRWFCDEYDEWDEPIVQGDAEDYDEL